ncbi:hypothetical protein Agub_g15872 [Astrephomene gubernaculifera]|uniref:YchJ-like middle NTF2-like domain-containing protein n=1 Tax=Astrephomene gubernaculifera TaxID=47775 RepID=A0AAD3HUA3_9CHLO|nr:hypothetical protein Agub_g15872 [Astrephomene gubernaculifera]
MLQARVQPFLSTPSLNRRACIRIACSKGFGVKPKAVPKPRKDQPAPEPCPCDSGKAYKNCCGPVHRGERIALTPEDTLRARFAAFCKGEADYIISTTHPDFHVNHYQISTPGGAEERLRQDAATACNRFAYTGLRVLASEPGDSELDGYVSFEYLSRSRSAPGAPLTAQEASDTAGWNRTAEKCKFVQAPNGVWQFADYQTTTFDASMLAGLPK